MSQHRAVLKGLLVLHLLISTALISIVPLRLPGTHVLGYEFSRPRRLEYLTHPLQSWP